MSDSGRLAAAIAEVALDIAEQLDLDGARTRELATLRQLLCGTADTPPVAARSRSPQTGSKGG